MVQLIRAVRYPPRVKTALKSKEVIAPETASVARYHARKVSFSIAHSRRFHTVTKFRSSEATPVIDQADQAVPLYDWPASAPFTMIRTLPPILLTVV